MPQDGLRSAVYRSFVKCDDPKGVAECRTMRKSKTNSKSLEGVFETKTKRNDLNHSPQNTVKGKSIDFKPIPYQESVRTSSLQLKEVSKGAQKLSHVIDTYSNGMRFDRNSKEIAKDLLKGALDLQESLMMLGKLQEASHYMAKFRKKPKKKTKDDRKEEQAKMERSKSEKYAGYNYKTGFQKPRFSVDGSSRDCFDELRTVIRDSLARQNLLPPNYQEKTNFSEGKVLDSMVDIPSTSSTQSSTMNFISFTSSDNSFSSDSTKRSKGSNLIAKLMGLEGIPSPQQFISSPKRFEIETISGPRRPMFEIDTTNVKKTQFGTYKEDMEEKRLQNIVETMRYKGLLKGNSSEESRDQSNYFTSNKNKKVLIEESPPIVIMKPMDVSRGEPEENDSQRLVRKSKYTNRGAVDFDEVCRRLRGESTPITKQGFREFKEKELSSNKLKEKKKIFEKTDKINVPKKITGATNNLKLKNASTSRDQANVNSIKEKKSETEPISRRRSVSPQKSNSPMVVSKNKPPLPVKRGDRKKNQKLDTDPIVDSLVEEVVERKHGKTQVDQICEAKFDNTSTSSTTAAQLLAKEETDGHVNQIKDQLENKKLETIAESDEKASYLNSNASTLNKCFENHTNEKKLFFSSPSFLKYAEELFNIETNSQTIQLQTASSYDPEITDTKLLLDFANELMLQKKLSTQAARSPFLTPPRSTKVSLSLTDLVDEVCKGIEGFSKYIEKGTDKVITETLFSVLEREMFGTGLANGAWESGWKNGYCFDDMEKVVGDIEKRVLDELIESLFTGFPELAF